MIFVSNFENDPIYIEPLLSRLARRLIRSYNLPRGKDRLFLILRSALKIPRLINIELAPRLRINLDLDDYLQRWIYCHKLSDEYDYHMVGKLLREGDHFVDVGANIGIVTLIASRAVGDSGMIYAVEALPSTKHALEANIRLNELKNVRVVPFALLDQVRDVEFFASVDGNIGGSSMSRDGSKGEPVIVEGRTFDVLMADATIERCDVMKIDIEGAEILALKGMTTLFTRNRPRAVMIEISERLLAQFDSNPREIINFFIERGYSWYVAERSGLRQLEHSEFEDFDNLWAILPDDINKEFLL
jgi:FkbM family methyltransferase